MKKLIKYIKKLLNKQCKHHWIKDNPNSQMHIHCDKCNKQAIYVGEQPL